MATDDTLRMDEQAWDREHAELSPSYMEEIHSVPESGTSAAREVGIEEVTDEDLLRGAWQGSTVTESHILRLRRRRQIPDGVETRVPPAGEI